MAQAILASHFGSSTLGNGPVATGGASRVWRLLGGYWEAIWGLLEATGVCGLGCMFAGRLLGAIGRLLRGYWVVTGRLLGGCLEATWRRPGTHCRLWAVAFCSRPTLSLLGGYGEATGRLLGCYWEAIGESRWQWWRPTSYMLGGYWEATERPLGG